MTATLAAQKSLLPHRIVSVRLTFLWEPTGFFFPPLRDVNRIRRTCQHLFLFTLSPTELTKYCFHFLTKWHTSSGVCLSTCNDDTAMVADEATMNTMCSELLNNVQMSYWSNDRHNNLCVGKTLVCLVCMCSLVFIKILKCTGYVSPLNIHDKARKVTLASCFSVCVCFVWKWKNSWPTWRSGDTENCPRATLSDFTMIKKKWVKSIGFSLKSDSGRRCLSVICHIRFIADSPSVFITYNMH